MKNYLKILLTLTLSTNILLAISIDTNKEKYVKGESITVDVTGLPKPKNCKDDGEARKSGSKKSNDCNWVGLFYANDKSDSKHLLKYQYAGTESSETFTFSGLSHSDTYEARVFYKNDYREKDSTSFEVASNAEEIQIKTVKDRFNINENITVTVSGLAGNKNDWIGIFYAFDGNEERHVVRRVETNGAKAGTFTLSGLSNDHKYEVRAFLNGSFIEEDYYPFEVIDNGEPGSVIINEVLASNAHKNVDPDFSKFSDWIELYNSGSKNINLGGYKLSDKISEAKWTIPNGTILKAHSYMLFWADEKDTSLLEHHTNFKLKGKGEAVALFDPSGALIDSLEFGAQTADISCAKNGATVAFMHATPYEKNGDMHAEATLSSAPQFSKNGGFYTDALSVTLSAVNGAEIYYTTDGSYPTYGSTLYTGAISIDKTTVLRAMSTENGKFHSKRITHTYLIGEESELPIISITTDEQYLWDPMIGIYTIGVNGSPMVCGNGNANFMQDWDRPANIEYFDTAHSLGFNQEVEISISGTCTREQAQKSLSIKADDIYDGKKSIDYKLFKEKDINKFKSFKLRNSGQDWWKTMFRDAMEQRLVSTSMDIDYQAYEPSIVFLNGEYWGIHNIREKKNEDFLANNYPNLDADNVDILYGYADVKEGKAADYEALIAYIKNNTLVDDSHYNYVARKVDINNYIDYYIAQIYFANFDWPANNIRYWKEQKEGAKWRWMMDDQDAGFNLYDEDPSDNPMDFGLYHDTLSFALAEDSDDWRNEDWSTFLFRSLMENANFQNAFVARYNTLLDSTFQSVNVKTLINSLKAVIADEMPRHIATWGDAGPDYANMGQWEDNVDVMIDFAENRPAIAREHLNNKF